MLGIICNTEYFKEIKKFADAQNYLIESRIIGEEIDIEEALLKLENVKFKHLIIHLDSLSQKELLPKALEGFDYDKMQIIIIVGTDYKPGNDIILNLIELGIYDIVKTELADETIQDLILDAVIHPSNPRQAKKWEKMIEESKEITSHEINKENNYQAVQEEEPAYLEEQDDYYESYKDHEEEPQIKRQVIERTITIIQEKIVGTVVIAVAGTQKRVGTTHTTLAMATFLAERGHKVAVIENHQTNVFSLIKESYKDVECTQDRFIFNNIAFFPVGANITNILQNEFNYLIIDMGVYEECDQDEFNRANKKILVSGSKEWEINHLEDILKKAIYKEKYLFYFTFCDEKSFSYISKNMKRLQAAQAVYNPNPFEVSGEAEKSFEILLDDVLPRQNKGKFFSFLRKDKK